MSKYKYKYYITHLVRHSQEHFGQNPEDEARNQNLINEYILSWLPNLEQVMAFHTLGLAGKWDWIGIFGTDDLAYWVGFRESFARAFPGHISEFQSNPGVSHESFVRGTAQSSHYQALRALGAEPGRAEIEQPLAAEIGSHGI